MEVLFGILILKAFRKELEKIPTIDDFEFIKPISRGAFGKVFLGHKKGKPERLYAIKAMKKVDMINKNLKDQVVTERDAMACTASPFIVQLYYSIQSQQNIFLVMEYLIGGDVKSLLSVAGFFDESMAFMYTAEVTLALEYLHNKGIIHRDLKPDNMLITEKGHIKLTDFGLSKISMNFNEVPMTPKTPMPYSQIHYDDHRTPGQILSLRSAFAFSVKKEPFTPSYCTTPSQWSSTSRNPLSELSDNKTPATPHNKLVKSKSLREFVLSQSATKKVPPTPVMIRETPEPMASTPPIKRLMSTLQDSLNWSKSTISEVENSRSIKPSMASSVASGASVPQKPLGLSFSAMDSGDCCGSIESSSSMFVDSTEISDNVFLTDHSQNLSSNCSSSGFVSSRMRTNCLKDSCSCKTDSEMNKSCSECKSHVKAPSRQETIDDDTPQMHRTDESVWNSYAAKNLRSLREGEDFSEDSDGSTASKENIPLASSSVRVEKPVQRKCNVKNMKPRKLVKTKSFSYPSDDESDAGSLRRYRGHKRFARKRSFQDIAQSPVHRAQSAESGLTGEFRLFHLEPCSKRSNSFPRTRIRFHSGSSDTELKDSKEKKASSLVNIDSLPKENLKKIAAGFPLVTESERLLKLFGDEKRQNDNMSIVLDSSHSGDSKNMSCEFESCDTKMYNGSEVKAEHENFKESFPESSIDLFDSVKDNAKKTNDTIASDIDLFDNTKDNSNKTADNAGSNMNMIDSVQDFANHTNGTVYSNMDLFHETDKRNPVESNESNTDVFHDLNNPHFSSNSLHNVNDSLDLTSDIHACHDVKVTAQKAKDSIDCMAPLHNRIAALKGHMVSSLKSEGDLKMMMHSDLSSIHESDLPSEITYDEDTSVFTSAMDSSWENRLSLSENLESKKESPVPDPPTKLLPPPLPKNRHTSGKNTTGKLKCNSEVSWLNDSTRGSSHGPQVPSTPEHTGKHRVMFHTPNLKYARTPETPFQRPLVRSHSFTAARKTPFRTPKSVRRAAPPREEERILGTPDYLAPEILQQKPHGKEVDWWALGVCLFEFLTGVPPFNDQTPDLVFQNILNRDIPWPEGEEALSPEAQEAIDSLLILDPADRPGARAVRKMAAFKDIDWHNLLDMEAPFIPQPDDETDTTYFEARNQLHDLFVSEVDF